MNKTALTMLFAFCLTQLIGCACSPRDEAGSTSSD